MKTVKLVDIKPRLSIFARAITGKSIDIYPAKREGGYKNNNFFLPVLYAELSTYEDNLSFYLFRILYLSVQKNLDINWQDHTDHPLEESQAKALESSKNILEKLYKEFPITKIIHAELLSYYHSKATAKIPIDHTFLYGKWMQNNPEDNSADKLKNFNEKAKKAIADEIKTILKANPVEEIVSLQIDQKQQEDYVLTHDFEKIDTAEEWDGGWRDFDGEDELDEHSKALEELNMKYTVRVDDTTHSVYQADFIENTTVAESSEINFDNYYIPYDEWDYSKREYKEDFCKLYPKNITETDVSYYKKTLKENASTLMGLRKMLTNVNNKYQQQRRQTQGEEFDIDAITDLYIDIHSGHTPSENIYLSKRKKEK
ncbi:MAG: NorD protein, partial [Bacteroidetes bacterium]